jgi:subfamily B ATP-binding cassette protein MsbA
VETKVSQSSLLLEVLGGIRVVKAFNLETRQTERFAEHARDLVRYGMKGVQAKELVNPIIETLAALVTGVLVVLLFRSGKTTEQMLAFPLGLGLAITPLKKIAGLHVLFEQSSAGVRRLAEILDERPTVREPQNPVTIRPFAESIRFDGVSFAYANQPVLRDVNLVIPRGQRVGVAGESGSGKSTLLNLLFRFYDPTQGSILLDGVDLRQIGTTDLRMQMALVSQEIVLFDQTVAENIACGRLGASRAEIEAAARAAFAHDFITALPHGYDTRIGERGVTLSGGQRQRLAIARAFVRNAPILVLDEATASLDSQSEAEVQASIDALAERRTVICVAHRLSTLANMDRIVVLERGVVVEDGSFDQLLKANGRFAAMARKQGF